MKNKTIKSEKTPNKKSPTLESPQKNDSVNSKKTEKKIIIIILVIVAVLLCCIMSTSAIVSITKFVKRVDENANKIVNDIYSEESAEDIEDPVDTLNQDETLAEETEENNTEESGTEEYDTITSFEGAHNPIKIPVDYSVTQDSDGKYVYKFNTSVRENNITGYDIKQYEFTSSFGDLIDHEILYGYKYSEASDGSLWQVDFDIYTQEFLNSYLTRQAYFADSSFIGGAIDSDNMSLLFWEEYEPSNIIRYTEKDLTNIGTGTAGTDIYRVTRPNKYGVNYYIYLSPKTPLEVCGFPVTLTTRADQDEYLCGFEGLSIGYKDPNKEDRSLRFACHENNEHRGECDAIAKSVYFINYSWE
ncbi:MAG TPA: hypothetical protein PKJ86_02145 [Candidatus Dojkabacteria bacterium]|nr:hypothetical protein [Candidatus Dojkabacteria bacterium]HQG57473.1 hypothetical protein [Candidatus Dojkabacteria bacterium]